MPNTPVAVSQSVAAPLEDLPPLAGDRAFWGMTGTQFLGAFNDNLFKQLILLLAVDYANRQAVTGDIYQAVASALFALPFVLFSGVAGWLSDCTSKRTIVVWMKVAEIAVMLAGTIAFLAGGLTAPMVVLFFMGLQSTFFGPAKYGILPEMLRLRDLAPANGVIQMTTFLAIILGAGAAGILKHEFGGELWNVTLVCVGIAVLGTFTSLAVRRTPIAHPRLAFDLSAFAGSGETWRMLLRDRPLLRVLMISSLFWFLGGVVQQAVNAFGKNQLQLGDVRTSFLVMFVAIGIAVGCLTAGRMSGGRIRFGLVRLGAWGMVCSLSALVWKGARVSAIDKLAQPALESSDYLHVLATVRSGEELTARIALTSLGIFAGLFVVPLQVFLQARPPENQKGRMIGTMNLVNWIGILLSAAFYFACTAVLDSLSLPVSWTFAATAALILPVAVLYRPHDEML